MKYFLTILICYLTSCSNSVVKEKLSGADSVVIHFHAPGTDSILKSVSTTEPAAIRKMSGFVDGDSTRLFKCGYDGSLFFFKADSMVLGSLFKFSEDSCRHFLFEIDDKLISTKMNKEGVDFLSSLKEGKTFY